MPVYCTYCNRSLFGFPLVCHGFRLLLLYHHQILLFCHRIGMMIVYVICRLQFCLLPVYRSCYMQAMCDIFDCLYPAILKSLIFWVRIWHFYMSQASYEWHFWLLVPRYFKLPVFLGTFAKLSYHQILFILHSLDWISLTHN